jgi:hypothetical protein
MKLPILKLGFLLALVLAASLWWLGEVAVESFSSKQSLLPSAHFPKRIWSFWDKDPKPKFVEKCIASWKKYNPDYEIVIVNQSTVAEYLPEVDFTRIKHIEGQPARYSDMVRLHLLAKYGGVWLDASILCQAPLTWMEDIFDKDAACEFVGYYLDAFTEPGMPKVIESWCFACRKDCAFVKEWLRQFLRISDYETVKDYIDQLKAEGVSMQKIDFVEYLSIHAAAQKVLQNGKIEPSLHLLKAEDTAFSYLVDAEWNSERAVEAVAAHQYDNQPLLKFRSRDRGPAEEKLA